MEKRVLLAVLLMSAVILLTNVLFPPEEPPAPERPAERPAAEAVQPAAPVAQAPVLTPEPAEVPARTVTVASPLYRYTFSTRGAAVVGAALPQYSSLIQEGEPVQLVPPGVRDFLSHQLVVGGDTLELGALPFQASAEEVELVEEGEPQVLRFTYGGNGGVGVEVVYTFRPDSYLVDVRGRVTGVPAGATLLTRLGPGLFTRDAAHELGVVALQGEELRRIPFGDVEGRRTLAGPLRWVGVKDKYFLAALVAAEGPGFRGVEARPMATRAVRVEGDEAEVVQVPQVATHTFLSLGPDGAFAYQAYVGPQEYERLAAIGYSLEEVTQYGYAWLRPIVRPIAAAALWVLSYLHNILGVSYGWALIIFGVLVKLALWPLNAKAMRAQMRNMAVQPLMQEIQKKYKTDPKRQQEEMVRLYKEHGFNPLAGCLPLLIPMPVFITLFFVFQNAIAFRGTEFWWMPDLSQRDPYYIIPVLFVVSTFLAQWVSTKLSGMETNPQMKMMMYVMPVMMGIFFFNFAAGLNLYYTASNIAGLPQQVLIARERKRATEAMKAKEEPPAPAKGGRPAQKQKRR